MNREIKFIGVGFHKCGTTTIDAILRQHSGICLPYALKETQFTSWCEKYNNPKKEFFKRYFKKDVSDRILGMIEPEFANTASLVKKHFGGDIKLLFFMRNPVEMLFSFFKMELIRGDYLEFYDGVYKEKGKYNITKMFDEFVAANVLRKESELYLRSIEFANYMRWIKDYMRFYPKENMRFYIFEMFVSNMEETINDIQSFIGLDKQILDCNIIENKGTQIAKNKFVAKVNKWFYQKEYNYRTPSGWDIESFAMFEYFFSLLRYMTCYTYESSDAKISKRARRICEDYYRDSKDELADFLGYDLNSIWYK